MKLDFSPKLAKKVYSGDGGSYFAWSPSELPMLHEGNIGAAKLVLDKDGSVHDEMIELQLENERIRDEIIAGFDCAKEGSQSERGGGNQNL
ncbi:hypothetical protein ACFX13_046155 [Malus domestica]